ncbi:MAG: tryptophan synthase subunit alpha, partial [Fimbriimonadaceae bacterium]
MISSTFDRLRARGEKALVAFVTAGDPSLAELPGVLGALIKGGADLIEVGIPFSDPIADGPVIQASSQRALDRGVTPRSVLEMLAQGKSTRGDVPVVLMGYYNPILKWGLDEFANAAKAAGVSGVIVCDLIPEEAGDWLNACSTHGLDSIFLAAPTSTDQRLDAVCKASTGFVYAVSRTGVTGSESSLAPDVRVLVERIKVRATVPVCVGFGISQPEHVATVCAVADG